ncbi:Bardet-Biedl syndrome 4 protein homolog isoform X2 [Wyeomyia smithii]|uniref:Bardet-Biedl syndrome 4 protein homolog isoform X2 n=1 Tax=Wyeomyia smithii TaxID=174621 RepID=UPI0024680ED2|nr:Bardet-Biedl syndrome 4 protein homolog isoform X2 [Wyeomyia smithii]
MTDTYVYCNGRTDSSAAPKHLQSETMTAKAAGNRNMNWLIHSLYTRNDYSLCKKLINRQLMINFDKEYLYYVKGLILRNEDSPSEAINCFQQAIMVNRKNPDNYKELAKTLFTMARFKQALEVFLKAETLLERPDPEVYHYIGELFYRNFGQPKAGLPEAKEYLKQSVMCGKHVDSYKILAEIYIDEGDNVKAIEMIESCLQVTQDDVTLMTQIGILYLKINEYQKAFEKLLDAIAIDDKCATALLALGSILQAISCLKKAVWGAPLNFNALYNLGLILVTAQQYVSAFQTLAAAICLRLDNADCYMLLGTCLRHLNDPGNAYLSMEKSTMLPDAIKNPLIYLNFALFCYEIGKPDQSVSYLTNFIEMTQHINVHREYLKMADRLNAALSPSINLRPICVPAADGSMTPATGASISAEHTDTGIHNEAERTFSADIARDNTSGYDETANDASGWKKEGSRDQIV